MCITEPDFLPFLNTSSAQKLKKTKTYKSEYKAANTAIWIIGNKQFFKVGLISDMIYGDICFYKCLFGK